MDKINIQKKIAWIIGPLVCLLIYNWPGDIISSDADKVIAIAAWMIIWWITEVVSISVTALIPLCLFPILNIMDLKAVGAQYGSPIVYLFFGGFVIALAMEKVNLHKRIALNIVKLTGTAPDRIILGFMLATAFLSMWISNTATTVVMLPIALSVINLLINDEDGFTKGDKNFALCLMLGIAFSANVGGIATIIGTPPNVVMVGFLENEYNMEIPFINWMLMGVPYSGIMLALIYFILVKWIYPNNLKSFDAGKALIESELETLGKINEKERRVTIIFCSAIVLWVFRTTIQKWLPDLSISDTGISMMAALALFAIPLKLKKDEFILGWKDTEKLPWGILILFGGGLALATGMSNAGIIDLIGQSISQIENINVFLVSLILVAVVLFMTELMSNVALVAIFAPMIAGVALGLDTEILTLLIPATMASSCAFMLPMATPPNAIVFASGHIKVSEMARAGIILNILAIILLMVFAKFVIPFLF